LPAIQKNQALVLSVTAVQAGSPVEEDGSFVLALNIDEPKSPPKHHCNCWNEWEKRLEFIWAGVQTDVKVDNFPCTV